MSARAEVRERPNTVLMVSMTAAGFVLLLVRTGISLAPARQAFLLGGIYAALTAGSTATSKPESERVVHPLVALGVGIAAILASSLVVGSPPPAAATAAWALPLALGAAVAEEAFFRRFLYARLLRRGALVAVAGSAIAFAAIHVPEYGGAALWVDLGAGLLLSWQRWASGSWAVPAATHAAANFLVVMR